MTKLARKLRVVDYFTLGFGTMVGAGWLVVMDDWLTRGGPLGAALGFVIGGLVLLPICYVYSKLVMAIPDAAAEIAYTARVFPQFLSFATGWMMMLAYLIVCPWEAVAIGKILGYIFPFLNSMVLYHVAGQPVYLPHVVIGLTLIGSMTYLNYRGIRLSATFQNWATFGLLALAVVFVSAGLAHGSAANFHPRFSHGPLLSILLVLQIVPYYMTGWESVSKVAEEASPEFKAGGFSRAMFAAIGVGIFFYAIVILTTGYAAPWQSITKERFATAAAFEHALGSHWIVSVIMTAVLLSLVKIFNGNLVAASRLLFALGRRELVNDRVADVHPRYQTPSAAILFLGIATAAAMLLGGAILVPISEVGSVAAALGWMASCASYLWMKPTPLGRCAAAFGVVVTLLMVLMKLVPLVPGHFSTWEWVSMGLWIVLGLAVRKPGSRAGESISAPDFAGQ